MVVHANVVMSTGLLPLARHYSSRLSLKVTIANGVYCLIVNNITIKKDLIVPSPKRRESLLFRRYSGK